MKLIITQNNMVYNSADVYRTVLDQFNGDHLATSVLMSKYLLRNINDDLVENSLDSIFRRISLALLEVENTYPNPLTLDTIFDIFKNNQFIFGGSNLYGIRNHLKVTSLGNCFVIGNTEDSYSGILQTDAEQAQLMKRRGGVGHDISHLRPSNTRVNNAAGTSTGAISFMERFSNTTREVGQAGRRGALMLTINVNHPDIIKFIKSKDNIDNLTGANISIKVTDEFMETVKSGKLFGLNFGKTTTYIDARELWKTIIHQAWKNGEPGVLFWDTIIENSPADSYEQFQTVSTNPCGEVPLSTYDSCRLGSIILPAFVENPFTKEAYFNYGSFGKAIKIAVRLMDDLIDLENEKIDKILSKINSEFKLNRIEEVLWLKIKDTLLAGRRTGLGILGLADTFAMLGIPYGSEQSIKLASKIIGCLSITTYSQSIILAEERKAFPAWSASKEKNNAFLKKIMKYFTSGEIDRYKKFGRRNIANLAIAPTGSLGIITQCSSGIEPVFDLNYTRRRKVEDDHPNRKYKDQSGDWWEEYEVIHPKFLMWLKSQNITKEEYLLNPSIAEKSPYWGSLSHQIDPINKIILQGELQNWIDHSISVTHNLPEDVKEEEVSKLYMMAWEAKCKGITVYRDKSRSGVLISKEDSKTNGFKQHDSIKRPKEVPCDIYITTSKGHKYVVCIGIVDDHPFEVFAFDYNDNFKIHGDEGIIRKIKKGHYDLIITNGDKTTIANITQNMSQSEEDRTRMISTALRHGANIKFVVEQLRKSKSDITDFSKVIARTLGKYIKNDSISSNICPDCNNNLVYEAGCNICKHCGYTKCE